MNTISSKCQNCGSELWYNPKEGCLTCKYCETNYFLPSKNEKAVMVRQYSAAFHPNQLNQALDAYKCGGCGNKYYMSSEEKTKRCPNCGNNHCEKVEDTGYCADSILPFKISKDEAAKYFMEYLKKKKNCPRAIKKLAQGQKLMGVFVPVWNFSYTVFANYSANSGDIRKSYDGSYYNITKPVFGDKAKRVRSLDKSACSVEDEIFLDLFDESDYDELIPYVPEYTYGYRVDAIDRDISDFYYKFTEEAKQEMKDSVKKYVIRKYKDVSDTSVDVQVDDVFFNFAYVPVFVNSYTYRGKIYKTYISGRTGKVVGKTPKTFFGFLKKALKFLGIAAIIGIICYYCL